MRRTAAKYAVIPATFIRRAALCAAFFLGTSLTHAAVSTPLLEAAYRGDAFDDEPYEDWADALRELVRAGWLRALRELARLHRRAGQLDQAVTVLVRLLAADPCDESAHRALVDVLLQARRHGEARRARRCRATNRSYSRAY